MAIAWSRISSKVIAHPPEPTEACRRRCRNWQGRSGVCIPHIADRRKQEVLGARDAAVTPLSQTRGGYVSRALGQTAITTDPRGIQEYTMSPTKRDAKKHAKARRRRYRQVHERLDRDRRQAQQAAEALEQALHDLGLPTDLVVEIEGRLRSQHKLLGKMIGMMCPPLFGCRTNQWC